jgi:hypothetical protein
MDDFNTRRAKGYLKKLIKQQIEISNLKAQLSNGSEPYTDDNDSLVNGKVILTVFLIGMVIFIYSYFSYNGFLDMSDYQAMWDDFIFSIEYGNYN